MTALISWSNCFQFNASNLDCYIAEGRLYLECVNQCRLMNWKSLHGDTVTLVGESLWGAGLLALASPLLVSNTIKLAKKIFQKREAENHLEENLITEKHSVFYPISSKYYMTSLGLCALGSVVTVTAIMANGPAPIQDNCIQMCENFFNSTLLG